jgi:hypothetical protein
MKRLSVLLCLILAGCGDPTDALSAMPVKPGKHKIVWCYGVDRRGNPRTKTFYADGVAFAVGRVLFVDDESGMECQIGLANVIVYSPVPKSGAPPYEP